MKTIKVSNEIYKKLMNISKELNKQDHLSMRMPYLFQIRDYKRVSCADGEGEGYVLICTDGDGEYDFSENLVSEAIEILENDGFDDIPKEIKETKHMSDLEDWLEDYDFIKRNYQNITTFTNGFFTKKQADSFLKANHYHFTEKAHVYLNPLWRNPEMELIMKVLCELSGGKLHT